MIGVDIKGSVFALAEYSSKYESVFTVILKVGVHTIPVFESILCTN